MNRVVHFVGVAVFVGAAFLFGRDQEEVFPKKAIQTQQYQYLCDKNKNISVSYSLNLSQLKINLDGNDFELKRALNPSLYEGEKFSVLVEDKVLYLTQDYETIRCEKK